MKYLFYSWKEVETKIKRADQILLLLDYDGTLTPIVSRPELAKLSKGMRNTLRLASQKYSTFIITGRSLKGIKEFVKLNGVCYSSSHGMVITGHGIKFIHSHVLKTQPTIRKITMKLGKRLKHIQGALIEYKVFSTAAHYRLVKNKDMKGFKKIFYEIVKTYKNVKVKEGKKVLEVMPNINWDKGKAVKLILNRCGKNTLPIYIGDDLTDEDAFSELKNGITIFVVSREKKNSNAKYYLKNVSEVKRFLERLTKKTF